MPVPRDLRQPLIEWYHINLCHPGPDRTERTIRRNFAWKNMQQDVRRLVTICNVCQRAKKHTNKYCKLPVKIAESKLWHKLCIELIASYKVMTLDNEVHNLHALTMIDVAM